MAKFKMTPTIHSEVIRTVRLGATGDGNGFTFTEDGKAVKMVGDSQYNLCTDGDEVEAIVTSIEVDKGTLDGYIIGGVARSGVFDAIVGSGTVNAGDYVVSAGEEAIGTKSLPKMKQSGSSGSTVTRVRCVSTDGAGTAASANDHILCEFV